MKKLTDREMMLILNGLAFTVDLLHKTSKGAIKDSKSLTSIEEAHAFAADIHKEQPTVSYTELDELFTKLTNQATYPTETTSAEDDLMNLPPNSKYLS